MIDPQGGNSTILTGTGLYDSKPTVKFWTRKMNFEKTLQHIQLYPNRHDVEALTI